MSMSLTSGARNGSPIEVQMKTLVAGREHYSNGYTILEI